MADSSYTLLQENDRFTNFQGDLSVTQQESDSDKLSHPGLAFFHLFIRCACCVVYLFCGWFSNSFVTSFLAIVLLLSVDFWTVKNISGRVLVGLRWWNYVDDQGKSKWVFESRKDYEKDKINQKEANLFWLTLFLFPVIWCLFFVVALFSLKFKWMVLVVIAILLNVSNLYGYIRCKIGKKEKMSTAASSFFQKQLFSGMFSSLAKGSTSDSNNRTLHV